MSDLRSDVSDVRSQIGRQFFLEFVKVRHFWKLIFWKLIFWDHHLCIFLNLDLLRWSTCKFQLFWIVIVGHYKESDASSPPCRIRPDLITRFCICFASMEWLRLVGFLKLQVSFAEYRLLYRSLLQKRPIILRSLLVEATPYSEDVWVYCYCVCACGAGCVRVCVCACMCVCVCAAWCVCV